MALWFQPRLAMVFVSQVVPLVGGKYIVSAGGVLPLPLSFVQAVKKGNIKRRSFCRFFIVISF